jgi:hypothetical protein
MMVLSTDVPFSLFDLSITAAKRQTNGRVNQPKIFGSRSKRECSAGKNLVEQLGDRDLQSALLSNRWGAAADHGQPVAAPVTSSTSQFTPL